MEQICIHWATSHSCWCEWERVSPVWGRRCVFSLLAIAQGGLLQGLFCKVNLLCNSAISPYREDSMCWKYICLGGKLKCASQIKVRILPAWLCVGIEVWVNAILLVLVPCFPWGCQRVPIWTGEMPQYCGLDGAFRALGLTLVCVLRFKLYLRNWQRVSRAELIQIWNRSLYAIYFFCT